MAPCLKASKNKLGQRLKRLVLAEAGLSHDAIVEMTTYYVGIHEHFDLFNEVKCEYVSDPFPLL